MTARVLSAKSKTVEDTRKLVQDVRHHETDTVVGIRMILSRTVEIITEAPLAVKYGLTTDNIADTVHPLPTYSEAFEHDCQAFRHAVQCRAPTSVGGGGRSVVRSDRQFERLGIVTRAVDRGPKLLTINSVRVKRDLEVLFAYTGTDSTDAVPILKADGDVVESVAQEK